MKLRALVTGSVFAALALLASRASAHCEIPCGIYGDEMRIVMLKEHISTVEKSMKSIEELGAQKAPTWNQLTRWIGNKESHASKIQEIVTQYFMTQRVKPPAATDQAARAKYTKELALLHALLIRAMKMKQTTDLAQVLAARKLVDDFAAAYFTSAQLQHILKHH